VLGSDLIRETWSLYGTWRPEGLPWLDLRLSRSNYFDERRSATDQTTDEATGGARYQVGGLEARYRFSWQNPVDHLTGTDTTSIANGGRVTYADRILRDRVSLFASYNLVNRTVETRVSGAGGTVSTQQFPVGGLSVIEPFASTPERVTLSPNGALVDGDTTAGAGLNIGFGPSLSGDTARRHMGAQLADAVTPVTAVWVWVDRQLPAAVTGALATSWKAYRSDDNLNWTEVPLAGPVVFQAFANRFEIPITTTQARYLKVVVTPLPAAVTTDARYRDILVTELQLYRIVPADQARGKSSNLRGDASAGVRVRILESVPLSYNFDGLLSHDSARSGVRYSLSNGLSLSTPLARALQLDARLERSDSDFGQGREDLNRASASLGYQPLPVLGTNLTYSGQIQHSAAGEEITNSINLFLRGDPYRGVSLSASGGYSLISFADGASGRQGTAQTGLALTPNRWLVLNGGFGYSRTRISGGRRAEVEDEQSRLDGSATVNPVPAIFVSAGVARLVSNGTPSTLVNVAANVAPFPGGDLFLGFTYNETLDTRSDLRVRNWGPSLRWKIRQSTYLDATYAILDSTSPAQDVYTKVFSARLALALP
jgi:hypothetical protein